MEIKIHVECNADTLFIEKLLHKMNIYNNPNHQEDCQIVIKKIENSTKFNQKIIGIIDKSKPQTKKIKNNKDYELLDNIEDIITFWKHTKTNNILINIEITIEKFILKITEDKPFKKYYTILQSYKHLEKITKKVTVKKNTEFNKLISNIIDSEDIYVEKLKSFFKEHFQSLETQ